MTSTIEGAGFLRTGMNQLRSMLRCHWGAVGADPAVVMEFKVFDPYDEKTLADTGARARAQIEDKHYVAGLVERGIAPERIRTYGIAFPWQGLLNELQALPEARAAFKYLALDGQADVIVRERTTRSLRPAVIEGGIIEYAYGQSAVTAV